MQFFTRRFDSDLYFPVPGAALVLCSQFPAPGAGAAAAMGHAACWDAGRGPGTLQAAGTAMIFPSFDEGFITHLAPKPWQLLAMWIGAATGTAMSEPPFAKGPAASF